MVMGRTQSGNAKGTNYHLWLLSCVRSTTHHRKASGIGLAWFRGGIWFPFVGVGPEPGEEVSALAPSAWGSRIETWLLGVRDLP